MRRSFLTSAVALGLAVIAAGSVAQAHDSKHGHPHHDSWSLELRYIGEATFPTGYTFEGTEVGGLSGIDYDAHRKLFYAISDDRSSAARFYTLAIDLNDGRLDNGDVAFTKATTLLDKNGAPFIAGTLDPESIRFSNFSHTLYWTSEGDADQLLPPFVRQMRLDGSFVRELATPQKYVPTSDASAGIRNNLAFESLSFSADGKTIYTATENALNQDGPAASLEDESPSRVLQFSLWSAKLRSEYIYKTDTVADEPIPADQFSTNGLVEILALAPGEFLTLERSFSVGVGNAIKIYKTTTTGASRVQGLDSIEGKHVRTMKKELVLDLATLGITLDNIEGMSFGPRLPTGERSLILVSDNNFSATQFTQFLAFAIETRKKLYAKH